MRPLLSAKLRTNNETKSMEKCGSTSGNVTANETKKLNELLQAKVLSELNVSDTHI
jgi:hypothetical protein